MRGVIYTIIPLNVIQDFRYSVLNYYKMDLMEIRDFPSKGTYSLLNNFHIMLIAGVV